MPQTITVDITPDEKTIYRRPTLFFSQGDIGRDCVVNIFSRTGLTVPSGSTAKIQGTKPSGMGFSVSCTVSGQTVSFSNTIEMTDEACNIPVKIEITNGGTVLGTARFNMMVEKNPHPDGTTDGTAEQLVPIITQLVNRAESAAESIHDLSAEASTLNPGTPATVAYDDELNKLSFGIPRGAMLTATDDGNGNITLTFS